MTSSMPDLAAFSPKKLKLHDFLTAQQRIAAHLNRPALYRSRYLSDLTGADVWLKPESLQPTGSFKVRGALHKLITLAENNPAHGIVTASAGNHGLGLAYAAERLGFGPVTIVIPESAPKTKVQKFRYFPVTLLQAGQTYEQAHQTAEHFALETGAVYVSAYNDVDIILGQGTCGLEIFSDLPKTDIILVPTGGGGLLSGIALVAKAINPLTRIVGVQPEASPAAKLSFSQGQPVDPYDHQPTIADGLAGGFGSLPFYLARTLVEQILICDESEIRRAVYTLVAQEQFVVEPSGAIAIAPLLQATRPIEFERQTVVCVLTGANLDPFLLASILSEFN
jgi:threonine dehydratase